MRCARQKPIDFASINVRLNASVVLTSGFGAPLRIAMPMPERATGVFEPASSLPALIRSSTNASVRIATSNGTPFSMSDRIGAASPQVMASVLPVVRSMSAPIFASTGFMATGLITFNSAALPTAMNANRYANRYAPDANKCFPRHDADPR